MAQVFFGVDPGQKGGIAIIDADNRFALAWRYPHDMNNATRLLREILAEHQVRLAAIEKVHSMPKQGIASSFKFGMNFGGWQWALCALQVPYVLVTPQQWQKQLLDAGTGETKARSLSMARRLFPSVDLSKKADDGKADALHLARWAMHMTGLQPPSKKKKLRSRRKL